MPKIMRLERKFTAVIYSLLIASIAACVSTGDVPASHSHIVISIVGTNDVHGQLSPSRNRGGLATVSGYVDALRAARRAGGDVLLIDAGDMWQGTLESNLNEGQVIVDAYNAMGYAAATIGNHEFDFGPAGKNTIPANVMEDARGALKQRATEMQFPLLAANLIDETTGKLVKWENVAPSTMLDASGVKIGVIGIMARRALQGTIAANTLGLRVAPLARAIRREATLLRDSGAALVIVSAHAGGRCEEFDDPTDLSSCDSNSEIMDVANALPAGLVDHIIAGHVHQGVAHFVNGIAITSSYSNTRAFSRVDFTLDRKTSEVVSRKIFPPQPACPHVDPANQLCDWQQGAGAVAASYEGFPVISNTEVVAIADRATAMVRQRKQEKLGVTLASPFTLDGNPESTLGNLVTNALLDSVDGDVAIHNVSGGLRSDLPQGDLTFGSVYEMSPFENRVVVLAIRGHELRKIIEQQVHVHGRRAAFAGMRVVIQCSADVMDVTMTRTSGQQIRDDDVVRVIANDYLAWGGDDILTPAMPEGGFEFRDNLPMTRDVIVQWLRNQGETLDPKDFQSGDAPRWSLPKPLTKSCSLPKPQR